MAAADPNAQQPAAPASIGQALSSAATSDQPGTPGIQTNVLTNISPNHPPPMKTLVYTPEIRILIARRNVEYDVSADVVACSVKRVENGVSSVVFRLANKPVDANSTNSNSQVKLRYNQLFERMDRVVVFLKRVEWVQVFSGYLDSVPHVQLYGGTVNFRASCTLKRLLHTWWDPGLPASSQLMNQFAENQAQGGGETDKGLGNLLRRLLVEVGNWSPTNIHVQAFPFGYWLFMEQQLLKYAKSDELVEKFRAMILGSTDTSAGVGEAAGRQVDVTRGAYGVSAPFYKLEIIRAVDAKGMGPDTINMGAAQGLGTAASSGTDEKDQQAWKQQTEVGINWEDAAKNSDAAILCFATVYAESGFRMLANASVPESMNFPNEGMGSDHSSIGLYQQQDNGAWGTVAQRMNARESTDMFLNALTRITNWRNMDPATAIAMVQRNRDGAKSYQPFIETSKQEVRALRGNTLPNTGASPTTGNIGTGALGGPGELTTAGAALGQTVMAAGLPTQNGVPTPASIGSAVGRPQFDLGAVVSFAQAQMGKPYHWGGEGPAAYDCSGLTMMAYRSIGMDIGGHNDLSQKDRGRPVAQSNAVPGDLYFPFDGHVTMYLGGGMIIEASQEGVPIGTRPIYGQGQFRHYPPAEYVGPGGTFNPAPQMSGPGVVPGTVADNGVGGTSQVGSSEPIARNLYSYQFEPGQFINKVSLLFGADNQQFEKAFINDEPLIQMVQAVAKGGLRNFCSAPNGDFVAYFPDYFGLDGKRAVLDLEDIEMKNVQIDLNDDAMATHVYVAGSPSPRASNMGIVGWLMSKGVATVENEWLFRRMTAAAPTVPGEVLKSGSEIMRQFGARPLVQEMPAIASGPMELLQAMHIFMTKWAEQYATSVELTFMPELFPGMRINLVGHNLQVYVAQVTHNCDYENGFSTSAVIMAPSNPNIAQIANSIDGGFSQIGADFANIMQTFVQGGWLNGISGITGGLGNLGGLGGFI